MPEIHIDEALRERINQLTSIYGSVNTVKQHLGLAHLSDDEFYSRLATERLDQLLKTLPLPKTNRAFSSKLHSVPKKPN